MPRSTSASSTRWENSAPWVSSRLRPHAVGVDDHPAHDPQREVLHVVEQDRRVGQDHALGARVRDVALVPQRDVLDARLGVAAQHAREAGDALGRDRVALVRHRARALLLPARNGSSTSRTSVRWRWRISVARRSSPAPASAIACSSSAWRSRGTTWVETGSAASPRRASTRALEVRAVRGVGADGAARSRPTAAWANARSQALGVAVRPRTRSPASLMPNVVGSAWTPCVRPTQTVSTCSRARSASARDELARAGDDDLAGAPELQRERGVEHVGATSGRSGSSGPAGPARSPSTSTNAATSWSVTALALLHGLDGERRGADRLEVGGASARPISSEAATSTRRQASMRASSVQSGADLGAGVAVDHGAIQCQACACRRAAPASRPAPPRSAAVPRARIAVDRARMPPTRRRRASPGRPDDDRGPARDRAAELTPARRRSPRDSRAPDARRRMRARAPAHDARSRGDRRRPPPTRPLRRPRGRLDARPSTARRADQSPVADAGRRAPARPARRSRRASGSRPGRPPARGGRRAAAKPRGRRAPASSIVAERGGARRRQPARAPHRGGEHAASRAPTSRCASRGGVQRREPSVADGGARVAAQVTTARDARSRSASQRGASTPAPTRDGRRRRRRPARARRRRRRDARSPARRARGASVSGHRRAAKICSDVGASSPLRRAGARGPRASAAARRRHAPLRRRGSARRGWPALRALSSPTHADRDARRHLHDRQHRVEPAQRAEAARAAARR